MALCELHWSSKILGKQVGTYVFIPDDAPPPWATFYLLHGLSDDYTIWLRRTSIERYAIKHPFAVVMPDGMRGWYTNNEQGPAFADHITQELVGLIDRTFPTLRTRESRGIGGLSMGGYGALRLGLGYPKLFASVTSHSGAVLYGSRPVPRKDGPVSEAEFARVFGKDPAGSEHDLLALAKRRKAGRNLPRIRLDCGTEDFLLADNREFHAKLQAMRINHEYEEFAGRNWDYWDIHVQEALAFHAKHLQTGG